MRQYRRTTLASKGSKQKKCNLSWKRVGLCQHICRTQRPCFSGGDTFPRINPGPCERGIRIDVRYVWTNQNGSFRKRIFLKTYTCARSLMMRRRTFSWRARKRRHSRVSVTRLHVLARCLGRCISYKQCDRYRRCETKS